MKNSIFLMLITICSLSSCSTMYNLRTIPLEMATPGLLELDKIDTIAIYNRSYNDTVNKVFVYKDATSNTIITDSLLDYKDISNTCLDVLADYLNNSGYFLQVNNYKDSLKIPLTADARSIPLDQTKKMHADAYVFLDYLDMNDKLMTDRNYFDRSVIASFPEFRKSTKLETIKVKVIWSVLLRGDSAYSTISKPDIVYYGNSTNPNFFGNSQNHRYLIKNTANYIGESFAITLLPSWNSNSAERTYYRSHNPQMLIAEKLLHKGDFIKAAEIYSKLTNNKNPNIVAKSTYNMAFINEMEGNMDASLDWLSKSLAAFKKGNTLHSYHCIQYSQILTSRKKELELLDKQTKAIE